MKKFTSIKTRITIWYTTLMFILVSVVLAIVGTLSYQLSIDSIENDIKAQVSQVSERVRDRVSKNIFYSVESDKEFKNVSIYLEDGSYVVGQYLYDLSSIPFEAKLRRETIDGKTYIVYDEFKPSKPGDNRGYWIRGAESVNYTKVLGRSMFMIILIIIPIILLITAFGGYYITRKAFLPVNDITRTANEICTQNDIKKRIPINPYGRESGHVIIKASKYGDSTEIVVADNGIGISSENLEKIWDRFYRVDDVRNDEYGSSGLGLSMVKSIVELHNGKIFVKSQLGKGTEFRIVL